jgi:hypothetical protein
MDITPLKDLLDGLSNVAVPAPTVGAPMPAGPDQPREAPGNGTPPVAKTFVLDTGGSMTAVDTVALTAQWTPPPRNTRPGPATSAGQPDEGVA